jgi:hypothetical protein
VRVPVRGIVADSHEDAIEQATDSVDLDTLFQHPEYEYADEITGYLVDEEDDPEYTRSTSYVYRDGKIVPELPAEVTHDHD